MARIDQPIDIAAVNDRLAREHPIDEYYTRSPFIIRAIERRRLAIIRRMVGPCEGLEVAEVGAGGGHVLRMFAGAHLTAFDVSEVYLETARRNLAGFDARFVKGEIDKMALPERCFDRIICSEVLEHTLDPEAILAALARLLRPDGVAVITIPNDPLILRLKGVVRRTPVGHLLRHRMEWGGDSYHLHRWTPAEFHRLLTRHLRVEERRSAPIDALPVRVCFRCLPR
jgi:2-polyprenyl-3-methyl-5-hydroxy-6-metoxy-1,4-benzoquinol methylase